MKNIIITGGELFNKGAQAMTFITVDEMKKRFSDHNIYVLSEMDLQRPEKEQEQYAFRFMGWYPLKFAKCQSNPILRTVCLLRNRKELMEAEAIYKNADLMIDISGYALGSNWSIETCNRYLDHLEFAKEFQIPVYLMPQSFGPFEFQGDEGGKIDKRIAELLPIVKVVCAREEEGFQQLKERYHLNNVILSNDLVLNNRSINLKNIYRDMPEILLPEVIPGSIAVIPNQRNYEVANESQVQNFYIFMIKKLLQICPAVYLISHSNLDINICKQLKTEFANESRVILIDKELNCIEFNEIVKNFHFIVASRFHAIVHAFKNNVPCIALGWATKYHELMKQFSQERYMLDVRQAISEDTINATIETMMNNRESNSQTIGKKLSKLQESNVFDIIKL